MIKTKNIRTGVLWLGIFMMLVAFDLPKGWFKKGSKPDSYDMGIDKGAGENGKNVATIKSIDRKINGFGTLMQMCLPDKFIGKRVQMSGSIKTKDVSEWAGLWFRIDQKNPGKELGFDNMHDGKKNRSIKGTTAWTRYEIVLDVPLNASKLAYGALLVGTGQIWFDNIKFDVIGDTIPTTGLGEDELTPNKEPVNLNFEK